MMEIREATEAEHAETGRITAEAYRGLVRDQAYLDRIADVADRAARTVILVAVEDGAIVGSLTLELTTRVNPATIRSRTIGPTSACSGSSRMPRVEGSAAPSCWRPSRALGSPARPR